MSGDGLFYVCVTQNKDLGLKKPASEPNQKQSVLKPSWGEFLLESQLNMLKDGDFFLASFFLPSTAHVLGVVEIT